MYDDYARGLIQHLPDLPDMDRDACRRALSAAYFHVVRTRAGIADQPADGDDLAEIVPLLRGMADALESVAVFDRLHGTNPSRGVEDASAFVAGESLALLSMLSEPSGGPSPQDPLQQPRNYVALESALLYMIGGYDINALSAVRGIATSDIGTDDTEQGVSPRLMNSAYALRRVIALCRGHVRRPRGAAGVPTAGYDRQPGRDSDSLRDHIRSCLYERMGRGVDAYLDWLGGYDEARLDVAVSTLEFVRAACVPSDYAGYSAFADIYHLSSLLLGVIDRTSHRSLVHRVPPPADGDASYTEQFQTYIKNRARGDENHAGRPFLWPSALQYVEECLTGARPNAVVSMPTGSGKGFIAELAIAHSLCSGWVLYIAPTNALAHQIRRDLTRALRPFEEITVRAFVGNKEYTTLSEEQVATPERSFVAVMTPEKCALALRLYPERFADCSLCVFDECHLLNDRERGVTADILVAQLSIAAPNARFILMSAMIGNPDDLAEWLESMGRGASAPLTVNWRPCRTMRGLLVLDEESFESKRAQAEIALQQLPTRRVRQRFAAPLALIAGLSGPWTVDGPPDYRITSLPLSFEAQASRRSHIPEFPSWKNASARALSELFARCGIPVICFVLTSRHHAFSAADKVTEGMPGTISGGAPFPPLVEAWLTIAEAELGVQTVLRDLFRRGVAVHTSAMLQPEQAASEWMFASQKAPLMFATGTLAEGLNLPAIAVVVGGTSLGDPRAWRSSTSTGASRADALILNAFGRAGRPGFSNQGIGVLVTDRPYLAQVTHQLDPAAALDKYKVLGQPDAAIEIHSPVEAFLDNILTGDFDPATATENELVLTSLLAEYDEADQHAGHVLSRTLAAYHRRDQFTEQVSDQVRLRVGGLKQEYLQQPGVPAWMNKAAMKAGVDFFRAWLMWQAYEQYGLVSTNQGEAYGVLDWFRAFSRVLSLLPPTQVRRYLPSQDVSRRTVLTVMRDRISAQREADTVPWEAPNDWSALWEELAALVINYMQGTSYADMASAYLGLQTGEITNRRNTGDAPIPAVLRFLRDVIDRMAIDAGCFLALHESAMGAASGTVVSLPEPIQALPLCIRNGCDSLGALSWYRFGYRQRICAHALQRAFPVPERLTGDAQRAEWVRRARSAWLAGTVVASGEPLLACARTVILESGLA